MMAMHEATRQKLWLGAVVVLGTIAAVQTLNNRDLRAELERETVSPEEIEKRVNDRASQLVVERAGRLRPEMIAAAQWLHSFYQSEEGLKRPNGLSIGDHPDFEGIGAWLFDVYLTQRLSGADDATARKAVVDAVQQSDEWRQKHPDAR
jgi:hypothetical protein